MKRGDEARKSLTNTLLETFKNNGAFLQDKKIYVTIPDGAFGSEEIQFAISITMPKTAVTSSSSLSEPNSNAVAGKKPPSATEMSDEDKAKVQELLKKLDIDTKF